MLEMIKYDANKNYYRTSVIFHQSEKNVKIMKKNSERLTIKTVKVQLEVSYKPRGAL